MTTRGHDQMHPNINICIYIYVYIYMYIYILSSRHTRGIPFLGMIYGIGHQPLFNQNKIVSSAMDGIAGRLGAGGLSTWGLVLDVAWLFI